VKTIAWWTTAVGALLAAGTARAAGLPRSTAAGGACNVPVACTGTTSGGWCVDTFFPADPTTPAFNAVWSSGPDDAWAVGSRPGGQPVDRAGFAFHWDGCAWSRAALPTPVALNDVWGSAPDDVWIVGGRGTALHWDGRDWTEVETGATGGFDHVSGTGPGDVWAIGGAGLYHWDGRSWSRDRRLQVSAGGRFLGDLWAAAPDDVWVAEGMNARGSVAHYDGSGWTVERISPESAFGLFGVWSNEITTWAVGEGDQVLRRDGGWRQVQPPQGSAEGWLNVMGSAGDLYATGQTVARATDGGPFRQVPDVPAGFYPGLWLTSSQAWIAGITSAGAAVVLHRSR
jgi:hypothetical protein